MITATATISASAELNNERRFQRLLKDHFPMVQSIVAPIEAKAAMYCYENMQLSEIAEVFGLTEGRICQIRREAVEVLRKYLKKLLA